MVDCGIRARIELISTNKYKSNNGTNMAPCALDSFLFSQMTNESLAVHAWSRTKVTPNPAGSEEEKRELIARRLAVSYWD